MIGSGAMRRLVHGLICTASGHLAGVEFCLSDGGSDGYASW